MKEEDEQEQRKDGSTDDCDDDDDNQPGLFQKKHNQKLIPTTTNIIAPHNSIHPPSSSSSSVSSPSVFLSSSSASSSLSFRYSVEPGLRMNERGLGACEVEVNGEEEEDEDDETQSDQHNKNSDCESDRESDRLSQTSIETNEDELNFPLKTQKQKEYESERFRATEEAHHQERKKADDDSQRQTHPINNKCESEFEYRWGSLDSSTLGLNNKLTPNANPNTPSIFSDEEEIIPETPYARDSDDDKDLSQYSPEGSHHLRSPIAEDPRQMESSDINISGCDCPSTHRFKTAQLNEKRHEERITALWNGIISQKKKLLNRSHSHTPFTLEQISQSSSVWIAAILTDFTKASSPVPCWEELMKLTRAEMDGIRFLFRALNQSGDENHIHSRCIHAIRRLTLLKRTLTLLEQNKSAQSSFDHHNQIT